MPKKKELTKNIYLQSFHCKFGATPVATIVDI